MKYLCCIYPAAPLVRSEDLIKGYKLLVENNVASVFGITEFEFPIFRGLKINDESFVEMFWPEHELTRSQDLPQAYHDAGQFYWLDSAKFLKNKKLYAEDAKPVILPRVLVQDIDTLEDLRGFFKKNYKMSSNSSKTITYLLQHKEILNEMDQSSGNSICLTNKKYR